MILDLPRARTGRCQLRVSSREEWTHLVLHTRRHTRRRPRISSLFIHSSSACTSSNRTIRQLLSVIHRTRRPRHSTNRRRRGIPPILEEPIAAIHRRSRGLPAKRHRTIVLRHSGRVAVWRKERVLGRTRRVCRRGTRHPCTGTVGEVVGRVHPADSGRRGPRGDGLGAVGCEEGVVGGRQAGWSIGRIHGGRDQRSQRKG